MLFIQPPPAPAQIDYDTELPIWISACGFPFSNKVNCSTIHLGSQYTQEPSSLAKYWATLFLTLSALLNVTPSPALSTAALTMCPSLSALYWASSSLTHSSYCTRPQHLELEAPKSFILWAPLATWDLLCPQHNLPLSLGLESSWIRKHGLLFPVPKAENLRWKPSSLF